MENYITKILDLEGGDVVSRTGSGNITEPKLLSLVKKDLETYKGRVIDYLDNMVISY